MLGDRKSFAPRFVSDGALVALGCVALGCVALGCSSTDFDFTGVTQKGPFNSGSTVTIQELDDDLAPTGVTYSTETTNDFGAFDLRTSLGSSYAEVLVDGFFFNEVYGRSTMAPITLRTVVDVDAPSLVNVNVLTHLEKLRLRKLLDEGADFGEARKQAQREVLAAFHIDVTKLSAQAWQERSFHTMDMTEIGDGHAALLAVSAILVQMAIESEMGVEAGLSSILSALSTDLEPDGVLTSDKWPEAIRLASMHLDLALVRTNLEARYDELGVALDAPAFEGFVDSDGDGVINKDDHDPPYGEKVAEGTPSMPVQLGDAEFVDVHPASVDTTASYYVVDNIEGAWAIDIYEATDDVDLYLYTSPTFTGLVCSSTEEGAAQDGCVLQQAYEHLYILVDGSKTADGALFNLSIQP